MAALSAGERVYADPMTCDWAHEEYRRIRGIDPSGLLLPLAAASDKTELCKEQTAEPVYLVNNALPLDERRKRKWWLPVAYFSQLPAVIVATLSAARATLARKLLLKSGATPDLPARKTGSTAMHFVCMHGPRNPGPHGSAVVASRTAGQCVSQGS